MTYLQEYQVYLEECMADGGTPREMEGAVREYNACGNPDHHPSPSFVRWFQTARHYCSTCGEAFDREGDTPSQTTLSEESTCPECLSGATTDPESADETGDSPRETPASDE